MAQVNTLRLDKLPPELLHHLMQVSYTSEARRLGSCSRLFREISLCYIHDTHHVGIFNVDRWDTYPGLLLESPALWDYVMNFLMDSCYVCDDYLDYLSSRPDILRRIRTLLISDEWSENVAIFRGTHYFRNRYPFADELMLTVVADSINLTHISIRFWHLTEDFLTIVSQLKNLTSIECRMCTIFPNSLGSVPSLSVSHLAVGLSGESMQRDI
ncbi:unnamed protein product [Somion occarium]|uniref:F-box domain-containing protein n=1 Tax=Somion occarium TaxID=3059160 RepID=A0ABP1CWF0_9APHY